MSSFEEPKEHVGSGIEADVTRVRFDSRSGLTYARFLVPDLGSIR